MQIDKMYNFEGLGVRHKNWFFVFVRIFKKKRENVYFTI